jgi:TonB family protein
MVMRLARAALVFLGLLAAPPLAAAPPAETTAGDAYVAAVRQRLATQRALLRPFYLSAGEVVLGLEIDRAGRLVNGLIVSGSGSRELDRAAARMATDAAPYAPPPATLTGNPITVKVVLRLPQTRVDWDALLAGAPEPRGEPWGR